MQIYRGMNLTLYQKNVTTYVQMSPTSKQAIIYIQVSDIDRVTEEKVTITVYGKSIKHIDPCELPIQGKSRSESC